MKKVKVQGVHKHKPIQKTKERFIKIGLRTYKVLNEIDETNIRIQMVKNDSKFQSSHERIEPFTLKLTKWIQFEEVENPIQE